MHRQSNCPVAFLIFNRPETTKRVFEAIRIAKPSKLFLIADGPRPGNISDEILCLEARAVIEGVDWDCQVYKNISDVNLGPKERVVSGLNWVFENVDRAIILEDDCLPHEDFFDYCEYLLNKYEHNERVMVITGNNFQDHQKRGNASYYFSAYPNIWGWATWASVWARYDPDITFWKDWKNSKNWLEKFRDDSARIYWEDKFDRVINSDIRAWDYQFTATIWHNNGVTITPNVNLVSNIGFGHDATHTFYKGDKNSNLPTSSIFPIVDPEEFQINLIADEYLENRNFSGNKPTLLSRIRVIVGRILGR